VIEFKPENSRAVSAGANQARGYATELNNELKNKDSSVIEKCKKFTYRVDCYRLCPKIDENRDFQEAHPDWKRDCGIDVTGDALGRALAGVATRVLVCLADCRDDVPGLLRR